MRLKKFELKSGSRFSPDAPVVIDFTESKYVKASGDNGVGKTTLLELFLMGCGQLSGEKVVEKLANKDNGKIDIDFSFVGKDRLSYEVRVTKSVFKLLYEGENVPQPLTKMKEILGVVGVSPMEVKNKPLKEIVKWLSSYTNKSPEEFEAKMEKIKDGIKRSKESRAAANRSLKALTEFLDNEPLFINWEESEKKYKKDIDVKSLSTQLDEAGKKSDKFIQAESKLRQLKEREESIAAKIEELQNEAEEIHKSIKTGEKFIDDNKSAKKEYDEVKKKYDNAAQESVAYNRWQEIKRKKTEKDEYEQMSQKADALEKSLLQDMKEMQMEILPDIKGVEIIPESTHENGGQVRKEGFYRDGISSAQMSETEWIGLVMEIWRKNKVKIVVIDNFESLGSYGIETLEKLIKDGCYVLVAEMDRTQKTLEIEYK